VGVVVEPLQEALPYVLVDVRVRRDLALPGFELAGVRELAVEEQIGNLEKRRALGQLLDRIAAIAQDPGLAVEEGSGPLGNRRSGCQ
jgi:hypothetical protein